MVSTGRDGERAQRYGKPKCQTRLTAKNRRIFNNYNAPAFAAAAC